MSESSEWKFSVFIFLKRMPSLDYLNKADLELHHIYVQQLADTQPEINTKYFKIRRYSLFNRVVNKNYIKFLLQL